MTQKPKKPAAKLTTEQAMRRLFPKPVVERAKEVAHEAPKSAPKVPDPSMSKE